jgi:hypothetical protein
MSIYCGNMGCVDIAGVSLYALVVHGVLCTYSLALGNLLCPDPCVEVLNAVFITPSFACKMHPAVLSGSCGVCWQGHTSRSLVTRHINQSINVTPVAMKLKKLMPAIH